MHYTRTYDYLPAKNELFKIQQEREKEVFKNQQEREKEVFKIRQERCLGEQKFGAARSEVGEAGALERERERERWWCGELHIFWYGTLGGT